MFYPYLIDLKPTQFRPTSIASTTPTPCLGRTYNVQASDDCKSISKSQGIGTAWLLMDNGLDAYCATFPKNGTLCLTHTCQTYTARQNDTCDSIAKFHNITATQLLAWNPVINTGCNNLNKTIDYSICVSEPGEQYNPSITPFPIVTAPTTASPAPTDVAEGTNRYCGKYYRAVAGDYCNLLTIKFGISLGDFAFLNPDINSK
jgi:LysM domain